MTLDFENPFAGFAHIVTGDRFIGRREGIEEIESRVIQPREAGNLAIVGMPGIGKSSLVEHTFTTRKQELLAKRRIPIRVNVSSYSDHREFFVWLVEGSVSELDQLGWLTPSIQNAIPRESQKTLPWASFYRSIQAFFKEVRQAEISVLFLLEEFDHARLLFKDNIQGFQGLRDLSDPPDWRVNFVTLTRRTIFEIELQTRAASTLFEIFPNPYYLIPFNKDDLRIYFERLASVGVTVTSKMKQQLHFYCGGHPYLLEIFGYEIVEAFRRKRHINVEDISRKIRTSWNHYFENITRRLQDDQKLDKLLQIAFGPVLDITQADIDNLQRYGLITENPGLKAHSNKAKAISAYTCFATSFQSYLRSQGRSMDLLPILRDTEKTLRHLISTELYNKHGEQWMEIVEQRLPTLFSECRAIQEEDRQSWQIASQNLLDYTYIGDLVTIMLYEKYWSTVFQPIFHSQKKNKNYWQERMHLIAKTRNPVMHTRIEVIPETSRYLCKQFCEEILQTVHTYLAAVKSRENPDK